MQRPQSASHRVRGPAPRHASAYGHASAPRRPPREPTSAGPRRTRRGSAPATGLALLALLLLPAVGPGFAPAAAFPGAQELAAQGSGNRSGPIAGAVESRLADVPFGPGERNEYQVKLGPVAVGEGVMSIGEIVPVRGRRSYHASWTVEGGVPFARVEDRYQSWFDVETLASRRFIQDIHQVRHENYRHFEIFPDERRWERSDADDGGETLSELPLDEIAFLYYVRTLPLEVGETYELDLYFRSDRNPVILRVLRREVIEVPAGTFETIVVQPVIKAGGLFGEGGEAEVYFSDDEDRTIVRLESRMPVVGSLSLHLTEQVPGRKLRR